MRTTIAVSLVTICIVLAAGGAIAQGANQILSVSPSSAAQGATSITITFTLDTDTPPAPPANILPTSVTIGSLTGSSVAHASQYTVTAQVSIPSGEAVGSKDVTIVFPTPTGTVTFSKSAAFTVTSANNPPSITQQPQAQSVVSGRSAAFTVAASGSTPLAYQWQKNRSDISGASSATLSITSVTASDAGQYRCVVTNSYGSATSDEAALAVTEAVWGSYPIVDTGQVKCYNASAEIPAPSAGQAFYGQDAQINGNQPSYTISADGFTVHDNVTGLTWQRSTDQNGDGSINYSDKYNYKDARLVPATLNAKHYGGYSDWRLPSIKEMFSLIKFTGGDPSSATGNDTSSLTPFIDNTVFKYGYGDTSAGERVIDSQYATTTMYAGGDAFSAEGKMFGVNFADGRIKGYGVSVNSSYKMFYVMCVRGNTAYGINDLVDNADQTITDRATGLMWAKNDSGAGMNWESALAWVQTKNSQNYLGHSDWRLPDAKELQSIVDYTRCPDTTSSAAIDPVFNCTAITNEDKKTDYPWYWTSTTHANYEGSGESADYLCFGRALGYMNSTWVDIHGAGAQRSDNKAGDITKFAYAPYGYYNSKAPQGDAERIYDYVRLVRNNTVRSLSAVNDAKAVADGEYVSLAEVVAATSQSDLSGCIYVENADRSAGIRVAMSGTVSGLVRGSKVRVVGRVASTSDGEKEIADAIVTVTGFDVELKPVGMNSNTIGGGAGGGQPGIKGSRGLNNVGLLVRVWGRVSTKGTGYFEITDGGKTIRIDSSRLAVEHNVDENVAVSGACSVRASGTDHYPLILPRGDADVDSFWDARQ